MKPKQFRALAERKRDHELTGYRTNEPDTWTCENEDMLGWSRLVYDAVLTALRGHPSKEQHLLANEFALRLGEYAGRLSAFGAGVSPQFEAWNPGWEQRYASAIQSLSQMSRALKNMGDDERYHWLPPYYAAKAAGVEGYEEQRKAINSWLSMTHALNEYFDTSLSQMETKTKVASALSSDVWIIADLWAKHFDEVPGAADGSPFVSVVQVFITSLYPESSAPSHPNISKALKPHIPKLKLFLQQKNTAS